jgi:mannose-6-phosphate isomerase-like protein (cupin superfamily)
MGFHRAVPAGLEFVERESPNDGPSRFTADLTEALELKQSRARLWRYPAHSAGRRHADKAQEEVFVVVSGTLTMLLGEPAERVDVSEGGVVAVEPGTPLQVRNETDAELTLFIYGAPPEQAGAEFFDDIPLPA